MLLNNFIGLAANGTHVTVECKVNEAGGISVGDVVAISGSTGNFPQVSLADNTVHDLAHIFGMAEETKSDGQTIKIRREGVVTGFSTNAFDAGDLLHLTTAGQYQKAVPTTGAHVHIGWVVKKNPSEGSILLGNMEWVHTITASAGYDIEIQVGDDAGATKVSIRDYNDVEVASIDSNGNISGNNLSGTNTGDEVQATETVAGIAEIATAAEVTAATGDDRIITPAKLGKAQANGVASLDGTGKVPSAQIPSIAHADTTGQTADDHHTEDHAPRHGPLGGDPLKLDDLATPDDNTDLNATTGAHGLLPKLGGGTTNFLRADGSWAAPAAAGGVSLEDEGTPVTGTPHTTLNFVGAGVTVANVDGDEATVTIPGGTGDPVQSTAGEISGVTAKHDLAEADTLLLNDSEDSQNPKAVPAAEILTGAEIVTRGGIYFQVEDPLPGTPDPICRWHLNDAASGPAGTIADSESSPFNLTTILDNSRPVHSQRAGPPVDTALYWAVAGEDGAPRAQYVGSKLHTALQGAKKFGIFTVVDVAALTTGSPILQISEYTGNWFRLYWVNATTLDLYTNHYSKGTFTIPDITSAGEVSIYIQHDSTQPVLADRLKLWFNGVSVSPLSSNVSLNDVIATITSTNYEVAIGNQPDTSGSSGNRSISGYIREVLFYVFDGVGGNDPLDDTQVSGLHNNWAALGSDQNPKVEPTQYKLTVFGRGPIAKGESSTSVPRTSTTYAAYATTTSFTLAASKTLFVRASYKWKHSENTTKTKAKLVVKEGAAIVSTVDYMLEAPTLNDGSEEIWSYVEGFVTLGPGDYTAELQFARAGASGTTTALRALVLAEEYEDV